MTKIGRIREDVRTKIRESLLNTLRDVLPDEFILELCVKELAGLRERILAPLAMLWYWVAAGLSREKSFAAVWSDLWTPVAADCPEVAGWRPEDTGVLTRARHRIPREALGKLRAEVVRQGQAERAKDDSYRGRRLLIWDGSTLSMPDEAELSVAFGKPRNQYGDGPFPVARMVNLLDAATGMVLESAWDCHRVSEQELAWRTASALQEKDVALADSNFAGKKNMARLNYRNVDFLMEKEYHREHPNEAV